MILQGASVVTGLRSRRVRRALVVAVLVLTASLGSSLPPSLHGTGVIVLVALCALDVLLVEATARLAFTRRPLDERESAWRDAAYRRGFRLLGLALLVAVLLGILSSYVWFSVSAGAPGTGPLYRELDNVVTGRGLAAILELLVMSPTLVLAWSIPDAPESGRSASRRRRLLVGCTAVAVVVGWVLLVDLSPVQAVGPGVNANGSSTSGPPGSSCRHFVGGRLVGAGFGATVGLRVEVCWNGTAAFVWGDPSLPLPASVQAALGVPEGAPPDFGNPDFAFLTACGADTVDDFATVTQTCSAVTDAAGTLHYAVHAHVTMLPGGLGDRDVAVVLTVDRRGAVIAAP